MQKQHDHLRRGWVAVTLAFFGLLVLSMVATAMGEFLVAIVCVVLAVLAGAVIEVLGAIDPDIR